MNNPMKDHKVPVQCPSCARALQVARLECGNCSTAVEGNFPLPILARLDPEAQALAINFIKKSGNLKELAQAYGVSYPTVRNRIDDLIEEVSALEKRSASRKED